MKFNLPKNRLKIEHDLSTYPILRQFTTHTLSLSLYHALSKPDISSRIDIQRTVHTEHAIPSWQTLAPLKWKQRNIHAAMCIKSCIKSEFRRIQPGK